MTQHMKPRRGALYLRVSTGDQHAENQRPEVEALARARGISIVLEGEENVSTRKARPAWERVMAAARSRKIDVVIIWAIDRLGRSMAGNLNTILELDRLGVETLSVRESWLDTGGPTRSLLVAIFSWVAEQERDQRSARTRAGLDRVRKRGVRLGRPCKSINLAAARSMLAVPGATRATVARKLKVSERTLYRLLKKTAASSAAPAP